MTKTAAGPERPQPLMSGREVIIFASVIAICIVFAIASAFVVTNYLHGIKRDANQPPVMFQPTGLIPNNTVEMTIWLSTAPLYTDQTYFGSGAPYVVVNYLGNGHLHQVLHYAEVTPVSVTGADVCQNRFIFKEFYVVNPTGGASNGTTNVTYASETYSSPFIDSLPGGSNCALRAGVEGTFDVLLCAERDGRIDEPGTVGGIPVIDTWDYCATQRFHGRLD